MRSTRNSRHLPKACSLIERIGDHTPAHHQAYYQAPYQARYQARYQAIGVPS